VPARQKPRRTGLAGGGTPDPGGATFAAPGTGEHQWATSGFSHSVSAVRLPLPGTGPEAASTVVWLRGEHDIATDGELRRVLACVIAANAAAIVVDLSEVELMSASTLGVIVTARKLLRQQSRSLTVRSPQPSSGALSPYAA
jgi:anti-anti-sigma factor